MTFDSDTEDDDESPLVTKSGAHGNPQKQIAYCSNETVVEFTPEKPWKSLSGLLPTDSWTTLLDDTDRQDLAKLLPALDGWNSLSADDALQQAVAALLGGDNLHFGNPLGKIDQEITMGRLTREVGDRNRIALWLMWRELSN